MNNTTLFNSISATRERFTSLVKSLSLEEINRQPKGFSNTIGWNFAHVIATQQLLVYGLSNTPFVIPQTFIDKYRKGTRPEAPISTEEVDEIFSFSDLTLNQLKSDLDSEIFKEFSSYTTSYGVTLNSIEESLSFVPIHEALHLGMCSARLKMKYE